MTLAAGTRLGSYEILAAIGAGGMGEVYKARDVRLERTVAIKVVPDSLSSSPEIRQRFEREARTISQLAHPHICALYDVGREGDVEYLVMEFLEGETLAERLARGALPLDQTLRFGGEIAEALDRAHRQGIVHRDLKPGNVMLTKSGVKLLDFGLALQRPLDAAGREQTAAAHHPTATNSLTALPTVAGDSPLTERGTILGTFQYMSPEQLEGKQADARTDLFALGAVLYEMATGNKAFPASSQASLITSIMSANPAPISTLQPMSPPALDRVVSTCLAKDPEERWQSAHDVASELRWIATGSGSAAAVATATRRSSRGSRLAWTAAAVCFAGMASFAAAYFRRPAPPAPRTMRFQIPLAEGSDVSSGIAISPDGTRIAFIATAPGAAPTLWVRALDSVDARSLPGTEDASLPFWSPDGRFLGFFANSSLKTIDVGADLTKILCAITGDPRGGTWLPDGTIVFAPSFQTPLLRIPALGGTPVPATKLDASKKEQTHRWPSVLPDGRHFLYYASKGGGEEPGEIWVGSIDGAPPKHLFTATSMAVFAPPGFLLFDSGRNLVAQPFDPKRLELSGEPRPISGQLGRITEMSGFRPFAASGAGLLAFQSGSGIRTSRLVWLDREGKEISAIADGLYYAPRLSRDGSRLAVARWDQATTIGDIWLFDMSRNVGSRFTFDPADESLSSWAPDGQRLIFGSSREGVMNLYQARADRSGSDEALLRSGAYKAPNDVSPDGQYLVYETMEQPKNSLGLWFVPLAGPATPKPVAGGLPGYASQFSPDGRWLAYTSGESNRDEVYVTAFPGPGGKWQVSVNGGKTARWRADGRELFFYGNDGNLMSVDVKTEPTFEAGVPRALFKVRLVPSPDRQYEVSSDGKRFLANVTTGAKETPPLTVVVDWAAGVSKR